ncbi:hypothetical protein PIN31009_03689 [Pandoraea iniqua]|uniref:hypothetical protein n=1 Tax=Pandoraea iniqua TaxID=2508288 RepID=UPI0012407FC2|nr:hypothetical protein [Pandoraea iniqua]VVE32312.1 hypothetical protein PIN31009_03689 [Pandoraea iniqua]
MLPAGSLSLPLHGYPSQQLSDVRANAISEAVRALHHTLFNEAGGAVESHAAFERFRRDVTQMGPWDHIKDIFSNGSRKRSILEALARCHIGSYLQGQRYLSATGEYPLKAGESSLYLLRHLTADARARMLMPKPDDLAYEPPTLATFGPPVHLRVPGVDLRLPLMADCFGDGDGAITPAEYDWLMCGAFIGGRSISQILSEKHERLSDAEYETLGLVHEGDALTYYRASQIKVASQLLQSAIEAFARLPSPDGLMRCLGHAQAIFRFAGDPVAVANVARWYATGCENAGRDHDAAQVRREVTEFQRIVNAPK